MLELPSLLKTQGGSPHHATCHPIAKGPFNHSYSASMLEILTFVRDYAPAGGGAAQSDENNGLTAAVDSDGAGC